MKKYIITISSVLALMFTLLLGNALSEPYYYGAYTFEDNVYFSTVQGIDSYSYGRANASMDPDPEADFQGTYLGTVSCKNGNDSVELLEAFLSWRLDWENPVISSYGKSETEDGVLNIHIPEGQTKDDDILYEDDMTEPYDDYELIAGKWQTYESGIDQGPYDEIEFLIVKGGTSFSVHQYAGGSFEGDWNVGYLKDNASGSLPALSHLTAYNAAVPVPEPASMLLLGVGLVGIAGVSRRRYRNQNK